MPQCTNEWTTINKDYSSQRYVDLNAIRFELQPRGRCVRGLRDPARGMITAIDGETGRILWKNPTDSQMLAGLVPTKGDLVFAGDVRTAWDPFSTWTRCGPSS